MKLSIALLLALLLWAPAAQARRGQDVLADHHRILFDRPAVPSDRPRGADVFAPAPLRTRGHADLFSFVRPTYHVLHEDVLRLRRVRPLPFHSPIFTDDFWTR